MKKTNSKDLQDKADGFINLPVSKGTREGLHTLKVAMGVKSQAEVVAKLVKLGLAIQQAAE